ncbi:MAG: hypothetical protein M1812_006715 [Candelaria pacifica]|nr:MAG: hypothetical protein M1812_006715 [Candelaria pacifica]
MTSTIERLPSELLDQIGDYLWDDSSAIQALRLSSNRLSAFGPLLPKINIFVTKESLAILAAVADSPVLSKQVCQVVCWVPLFHKSYSEASAYAQAVYEQVKWYYHLRFRPDPLEHGFRYAAAVGAANEDKAKELAVQFCKDNPEQGFENYVQYYSEQEELLSTAYVATLSKALSSFPRLRTVKVKLVDNTRRDFKLHLSKSRDFMFDVGESGPIRDEHPKEFLQHVIQAVANSQKSLETFIASKSLWSYSQGVSLRMLPTTKQEYDNMRTILRTLRHLMLGLTDADDHLPNTTGEHSSQIPRLLQLAPSLQHLCLSLGHSKHGHIRFGSLTWPALNTLKLRCLSVDGADLLAFLARHLAMGLTRIDIWSVYIAEGSWKPILELLRGFKKEKEDGCVMMTDLRSEWGQHPYEGEIIEDYHDEEMEVYKFLAGTGDWTWRLEHVYG